MVVKSELEKLGLHYTSVELGEAEIKENISKKKEVRLRDALLSAGLELMEDSKTIMAEKITTAIIELIYHSEKQIKVNLSDHLSEKLNHNYRYLASIFTEVKGMTIEKYYLSHKIEMIKELLIYTDLSITEIAWKMHYSSEAHLSNQFKKMTGLTPSEFKKLKYNRRLISRDI